MNTKLIKLRVHEHKIIPIANATPDIIPIFRYPKFLCNAPLTKPIDILNAEFILMTSEMSLADKFMAVSLSLKIKPKFVIVGTSIP